MGDKHTFRAVIEDAGGGGAYVLVPLDVEQAFGKKRVKVKALIEGIPYRGLLVRMGSPSHMLPVLKNIREQTGKSFGHEIEVVLEEDLEERVIEVPPDLARAFAENPDAAGFFDGLAFTHKKEYVNWINEAKQDATRQNRVAKTIEMLKQGKKTHRPGG
jgi:hypothetical protein